MPSGQNGFSMTALEEATPMADAIPFNRSAKAERAPKSNASAEELLAFERMLADLSARFANVPVEKVELEIRVVQAILLKFLGFDRCTFAEFQDDGSLVVLSSNAVEGVEATPPGPLPSQLDWFVARTPGRRDLQGTKPCRRSSARSGRRGRIFPADRDAFAS